MNKFKLFLAKHIFKKELNDSMSVEDKAGSSIGKEQVSSYVKKVTLKINDEKDFEESKFSLEDIQAAYDTDSYVRQGVDKYIDQIFKEGYSLFGADINVVDYIKLRLEYIAEATNTPTNQLLIDIAEDIVKYGNAIVVKSRTNDTNAFPQGASVTGLYGFDPVAGYFCANPVYTQCKRDKNGVVKQWKQETDAGKATFKPEDVIHFYYKREKGSAYGTSFLVPVLDDVRALRQAEENALKMMYRSIYPFHHIAVGTEEAPGTKAEVDELQEVLDNMELDGGVVTTERVKITPVASDKVIDAHPYLQYMEQRVFSGLGVPAIMFGRGNCYTKDTLTLTNNGWKYFYEITKNDLIATFNPDTQNIEYHIPNGEDAIDKYYSFFSGDMVRIKGYGVDIKVTKDHDIYVCECDQSGIPIGKWHKEKAEDLMEKYDNFLVKRGSEGIIQEKNSYENNTFLLIGETEDDIITLDKYNFVKFCGYYLSFGKVEEDNCISFSCPSVKQFNELMLCLHNLCLDYDVRQDTVSMLNTVIVKNKDFVYWTIKNIGTTIKTIPRFICNSGISYMDTFLYILSVKPNSYMFDTNYLQIVTQSESIKDSLQEICVRLGYTVTITANGVYKLIIHRTGDKHIEMTKNNVHYEKYEGPIYCYNVPNHLFITKRNDCIAIQGNTANRSTGDNMTSEMADRIRAIIKVIEMFFNSFIIKELLMEGGYDPILNPDQKVELKFYDNDVDVMIKKEVHAIYKYEHNAITEDEMRDLLGMDPIEDNEDRSKMFVELITRQNLALQAEKKQDSSTGTKETDNKQKNGGGAKPKDSAYHNRTYHVGSIGTIKDIIDMMETMITNYVSKSIDNKEEISSSVILNKIVAVNKDILYTANELVSSDNSNIDSIGNLSILLMKRINKDMASKKYISKESVMDMIKLNIDIYRYEVLDKLNKQITELKNG